MFGRDNTVVLTVGDIGETILLERLLKRSRESVLLIPSDSALNLHIGAGDDAAGWRVSNFPEVMTTDAMVEGVHFDRATSSWSDVGWKLWVSNVSDIVAMAGIPTIGVVNLGLPRDFLVQAVDEIYDGLIEACTFCKTAIVGGDVVSSPNVFLSVTLIGICASVPLSRSSAQTGDLLALTGPVGASAGGLRVLQSQLLHPNASALSVLCEGHRRPQLRLQSGSDLSKAGITCAMDVSDGLIGDLRKISHASGLGIRLHADQVPFPPELSILFGDEALGLALTGGEDYQIVFAGPPDFVRKAISYIPEAAIIGSVTDEPAGTLEILDKKGEELTLDGSSWEHWR